MGPLGMQQSVYLAMMTLAAITMLSIKMSPVSNSSDGDQ